MGPQERSTLEEWEQVKGLVGYKKVGGEQHISQSAF